MPSLFTSILAIAAAASWATWVGRAGLLAIQIFQIEEYEPPRLLQWGRQPAWRWPRAVLLASGLVLLLGLLALAPGLPATLVLAVAVLLAGLALNGLWRRPPAKKPLVYTPRVRRILLVAILLLGLLAAGLAVALLLLPLVVALLLAVLAYLLAPQLAIWLTIVANWLLRPVEARIQRGFVRQAQARIAQYRPRVVGIAGSYGKTSTKQITAQLLAPQMATFATPKSFNTLMGITRTINEHLKPDHRLFLVEMDAYGPGEIHAMAELTTPELAIITSVGPQHLERFGTVDKIGAALYELVAALPPGAPAIIYAGEAESARLAARAAAAGYRVVRYGIAGEAVNLDVVADMLTVDEQATRFVWRWAAEGLELPVSIPLLGRHNILNVCAALAATHLLGGSAAQAARAAALLEPVAHRLQVLPNSGGVTVIDDSYNANPVGVHNGLDVLASWRARRKILVTPGMVELGSLQERENRRYGEHAAQVCDQVILVGAAQTRPLQEGLRAGGMASERVHIVQTLGEVTALLGQLAGPGDVVLFANDLPDSYLEL